MFLDGYNGPNVLIGPAPALAGAPDPKGGSAVPEPGSVGLLALGALGIVGRRNRRK